MLMTPIKERNALVTLQLRPVIDMTNDQFFEFCQLNRDWHIERTKEGEAEEKKIFLPLCPDFIIKLRSPSDSLSSLHEKMEEFLENGAQLGWLIDPEERQVFVYHPGQPVEHLKNPSTLSGDPLLPGFTLDLKEIWEPDF